MNSERERSEREDMLYAKQQLNISNQGKCKVLGLIWDKKKDQLGVTVPSPEGNPSQPCKDL